MDRPVLVTLETVDGEATSFTIDKKDMGFPEFGFMYTIRRATNPKEERNIIIPWPQVKKIIVDEQLQEEKDDGNK